MKPFIIVDSLTEIELNYELEPEDPIDHSLIGDFIITLTATLDDWP